MEIQRSTNHKPIMASSSPSKTSASAATAAGATRRLAVLQRHVCAGSAGGGAGGGAGAGAAAPLLAPKGSKPGTFRVERDSLGEVRVPSTMYYGAQVSEHTAAVFSIPWPRLLYGATHRLSGHCRTFELEAETAACRLKSFMVSHAACFAISPNTHMCVSVCLCSLCCCEKVGCHCEHAAWVAG